jgi:hypothetical protein
MKEAARTSETSVDNYFTRQYIPEDNSELQLSISSAFVTAELVSVSIVFPSQESSAAVRISLGVPSPTFFISMLSEVLCYSTFPLTSYAGVSVGVSVTVPPFSSQEATGAGFLTSSLSRLESPLRSLSTLHNHLVIPVKTL